MDTPNTTVYEALKTLITEAGVKSVGKPNQNVFTEFPAITYRIADNHNTLDLDNEIASQTVEVVVDIWSDKSMGATDLLPLVEAKLRPLFYNCVFSSEVPNPTEDVYHVTARFRAVNV